MVTWLAGNRIRGTTAERPSASLQSPSVGGWVEVGRTTLGSAGNLVSVASLSDKRYYMILFDKIASGNAKSELRLNNDSSGTNGVDGKYSDRKSAYGGADTTRINQTNVRMDITPSFDDWIVGYVSNLSSKEKLGLFHQANTGASGATGVPERFEIALKWANTSDAISRFDFVNSDSGSYDTNSECVVLGWDPADTHTTNFWEELDSVTLGSSNANLASNTFTAKKYLWIQAWFNISGADDLRMTFNSDSGNNYAHRMQQNGGTDVTYTTQDDLRINYSTTASPTFVNLFIVNNASNEKLITGHMTNSGGSGAGTAPDRRIEFVGKWTNTSAQITSMNFYKGWAGAPDYTSGTTLKVWGSD